ncbi:SGNH/GDSL hydrolase family protein [Pendulispora albinea]|uniref:SGNH/GDSL hydrolase family protein n=1 Tax=Pendulispora albinea TaxID=2741071 RepID=A0ABZ2M8S0_9BACT
MRTSRALVSFAMVATLGCGSDPTSPKSDSPAAPSASPAAPSASPAAPSASNPSPAPDPVPAPDPAAPRLTPDRVHTVLHLGDSMVGFRRGLTMALETRFKSAGAKFYSNSWTSAQIRTFDEDERLTKLVRKAKPDIVILNLGSNNVLNPNPEALAANIRSIVKKMQPAACYWLGPPLPIKAVKRDKGVRRVIAENIAPCKFFDTSRLVLERQTDHIHPTDRGGEIWADAVWRFIFDDEPSHRVDPETDGQAKPEAAPPGTGNPGHPGEPGDPKATHAKR